MKLFRALALALFVSTLGFAQNAALLPVPTQTFLDANGKPLAGGYIYTCVAGSGCSASTVGGPPSTPLAAYTSSAGTTTLPNPVVLDSGGRASIWLGASAYKIVAQNYAGVVQWTQDNVSDPVLALSSGAVLKSPPGNASQTITGPLNLSTYGLTANNLTSCIQNGLYVTGSSCYSNIAAAQAAAGSGCTLIPPTYAGTDGPVNGNSCILDLRRNAIASSHYFNCVYPLAGASGGADCALVANGAGDVYLSHNTQVNPATTTTTAMVAGANTVTVASTALFGSGATSPLIVGRETPNMEAITSANWSAVDATHLNIFCAKAHTPGGANNNNASAIDIEMLGLTHLDAGLAFTIQSHKPSQLTTRSAPEVFFENNGDAFMTWPGNISDVFPYNGFGLTVPITGFQATGYPIGPAYNPADVKIQNASSGVCTDLVNSTASLNLLRVCDTTIQVQQAITPANGGTLSLGSASLAFGNIFLGSGGGVANTQIGSNATAARTFVLPDANAKATIAASVTTTAATSDAFTIQGLTASSLCVAFPANASAATNVATTYQSAVGANSLTLAHTATAGMIYNVHCTY
jgi:hypothetical protein